MIRSDKMRTTYEIDCLKFSKLSISSPPNSRKDYSRSSVVAATNVAAAAAAASMAAATVGHHHHHHHHLHHNHHHHNHHHHHHHHQNHNRQNMNGYGKPLLPRIDFPTSQFDRLLHMDQKEFNNNSKKHIGFRSTAYDDNNKKNHKK
nr:dendritic arbor reduction protein 1-like [Dermatophagoides farinae]